MMKMEAKERLRRWERALGRDSKCSVSGGRELILIQKRRREIRVDPDEFIMRGFARIQKTNFLDLKESS